MFITKNVKYFYPFATMAWTHGRKPGKDALKKRYAYPRYKSRIGADFTTSERKAIILHSNGLIPDILFKDTFPLNSKKENIYINRYRFGLVRKQEK